MPCSEWPRRAARARTEDIVTAAQEAQEKAEKAPADGQKIVTAESYSQLQADAEAGRKAAETLDERDRSAA